MLLELAEANRLVEPACWIVLVHAEAQSCVPLSNACLDEVDEEPSSNPLVPTRRDNSDRYLGDILGDVAVTMHSQHSSCNFTKNLKPC